MNQSDTTPDTGDLAAMGAPTAYFENTERLAATLRQARLGHWEWDPDAGRVAASEEVARIFGLPVDQRWHDHQVLWDQVHPQDRDQVRRHLEQARQAGLPFMHFYRLRRPDGSERVVHASGYVEQDDAGQVIRIAGTAQDVTDLYRTETRLAQTVRQLAALNRLGQAMATRFDLAQIYDEVLTTLQRLLDAAVIAILIDQGPGLELAASSHPAATGEPGRRIPAGHGLIDQVWRGGQPLLAQGDTLPAQVWTALFEDAGDRVPASLVAAPLRWQDRSLGVLLAGQRQPAAFDEETLRLLETAATWTAIAIGNARQHAELARKFRQSQAVANISQALSETLDLQEVLHLIVSVAREHIPSADWAAIHLLEGEPQRLYPVAAAGLALKPDEYVLHPGEGIAGQVIEDGQVINVMDVQTDPRRLPVDQSINVRSLLVGPVQSLSGRIGTISVQCARPDTFTASDEQLLTILGAQAGLAIENARLFEAQLKARRDIERQHGRLRTLTRKVFSAQEKERQRIARELHDEAGQALTSLKISLELINGSVPLELGDVRENLDGAIALVDSTMENLRLLAHNLRPPVLDTFGLDRALAGLCQEFSDRTRLPVQYDGVDPPGVTPWMALALYRCVQEALTNVARHAVASQVAVRLGLEDGHLHLSVTDDGRGFTGPAPDSESEKPAGIGLVSMSERIELLGGRLEVIGRPGRGTRLLATVPFEVKAELK